MTSIPEFIARYFQQFKFYCYIYCTGVFLKHFYLTTAFSEIMGKRSAVFGEIAALAKERILMIDGAMGTMIQREHLEENDFRGEVEQLLY